MVDVTIRGAGIFGLSIAWACAQRGARVVVVDPAPLSGASGGIVGALAPHVPENWNAKKAFQLESLLMAEGFWAGVAEHGGDPGYARTGRVQPVADDHALELARARVDGAACYWQGRADWQVMQAAGDWAPYSPTGWFIRDTLTARIHPRQACNALMRAIEAKGGRIVPEAADQGQVLWATGVADLQRLSVGHRRLIGSGVKGQAALLDLALPDAPQLFADTVHIVPHADGTTAIGSTSERAYDDPSSTDAQLDDLLKRARQAVPALAGAQVIGRWAGLRPRSRSRAPMLGAHPLHPGQFIANGGFKIGFGMAPKVAQVMADLMLEGRDAVPEGFRPEASY